MFDSIDSAKNEIYYSKDGKQITVGQAFSDDIIELYKKYGGYPSLDMGYTVFGQSFKAYRRNDKRRYGYCRQDCINKNRRF